VLSKTTDVTLKSRPVSQPRIDRETSHACHVISVAFRCGHKRAIAEKSRCGTLVKSLTAVCAEFPIFMFVMYITVTGYEFYYLRSRKTLLRKYQFKQSFPRSGLRSSAS
jgi:hypothetical protein